MLSLLSLGKTFANTCKCFSRFSNGTSTLSNDSTILLCPGSSTSIAPNIITFSNDVFEWQSSLNPGVVISNSSTLNVTADNDCDYILTITRGTGELQKALSFVFHIILKPVPVMDMPVNACDTYTWPINNTTYTSNAEVTVYGGASNNGCDSIYNLHLTINNSQHNVIDESKCDSYIWHGTNYTQSGTFTYSYISDNNCLSTDTLKLQITNSTHNAYTVTSCGDYTWNGNIYNFSSTETYSYTNSSNCPSTDTLHLTVNQPTNDTIPVSAWDSYNFFGTEYTSTTNSPTFTYPGGNWKGCDSTIHLHLTILGHKLGTDTRTACESFTWRCNDETYTTSTNGIIASGGADADGCDSIITLNLTINHGTHNVESLATCSTYSWHGQNYPSSGTYTYPYVNAQNCPSTDTLRLTVNSPSSSTITASACDSYNFFGTEYTSTTNSPTFTYPGGNWKGCDSTIHLHLTILGHKLGTDSPIECDSYTWFRNGVTYNTSTSGVQVFGGVDANGCDSIITLNLTLNHGQFNAETINACDSYQWNDNTYTSSGSYTHYSTNSNGCTDTAVLTLNITESIHNTYHKTACKSYDWDVNGNGQSHFTSSGTYLDYWSANGCENSDTLVLTILDYEVPSIETLVQKKHKGTTNPWMLIYPRSADDGKYFYQWYRNDSLINGADKQYFQLPQESPGNQVTYSVMVSSNPMAYCATISSATITFVANKSTSVNTTPNPNNGTFTIGLSSTYYQAIKAEFYNTYGTLIAEIPLVDNLANIEGLLPQGVYFVRITTTTGECFTEKVIIR